MVSVSYREGGLEFPLPPPPPEILKLSMVVILAIYMLLNISMCHLNVVWKFLSQIAIWEDVRFLLPSCFCSSPPSQNPDGVQTDTCGAFKQPKYRSLVKPLSAGCVNTVVGCWILSRTCNLDQKQKIYTLSLACCLKPTRYYIWRMT